jgi:hypothetical protein
MDSTHKVNVPQLLHVAPRSTGLGLQCELVFFYRWHSVCGGLVLGGEKTRPVRETMDYIASAIADVSSADLKKVWNPNEQFCALLRVASELGGNGQLAPTPAEAGLRILDACASSGHASFVADYIKEICADPGVSSTSISDMTMLDGDLVQQWLLSSIARLEADLQGVCCTGNGIHDELLLSKMRTQLISYASINSVVQSAGLDSKGVPDGAPGTS